MVIKMDFVLPQIISIGIYNSQIAQKGRAVSINRKTALFEIEIPIEAGGVSYIDSQYMQISPDMLICAKPGQTRHTKFPFKCYYIHMSLNNGVLFDSLIHMPSFIKTDKYDIYCEIFKKLCKFYDSGLDSDKIIVYSLIFELIYRLIGDSGRLLSPNNIKNSNYTSIENTIRYIKNNLNSDLSLKTVAAYSGFSPIYFHNLFKAFTGKTLRDYVEEMRVKKAADMIVSTNYTLTQIAYECGFSSQSYFSYAFRRRMKLTPREYGRAVFERYETEK